MIRYVNTPPYLYNQPHQSPWVEVRAAAALLDYPSARARAVERGLDASWFSSEFSRALVAEALAGQEMSVGVMEKFNRNVSGFLPWRTSIWLSRQLVDWGTQTEASAFAAIDMFMAQIAGDQVPATFRWAADRYETGQFSRKDRRELDSLLDAAGVTL